MAKHWLFNRLWLTEFPWFSYENLLKRTQHLHSEQPLFCGYREKKSALGEISYLRLCEQRYLETDCLFKVHPPVSQGGQTHQTMYTATSTARHSCFFTYLLSWKIMEAGGRTLPSRVAPWLATTHLRRSPRKSAAIHITKNAAEKMNSCHRVMC